MRRVFPAETSPAVRRWAQRAAACLLVVLALMALPIRVRASAWTEPQGHGLVVADYTFDGGSRYFNGEGHLAPATAYRKQELTGYLEYGVTDCVTGKNRWHRAGIYGTKRDRPKS